MNIIRTSYNKNTEYIKSEGVLLIILVLCYNNGKYQITRILIKIKKSVYVYENFKQ